MPLIPLQNNGFCLQSMTARRTIWPRWAMDEFLSSIEALLGKRNLLLGSQDGPPTFRRREAGHFICFLLEGGRIFFSGGNVFANPVALLPSRLDLRVSNTFTKCQAFLPTLHKISKTSTPACSYRQPRIRGSLILRRRRSGH